MSKMFVHYSGTVAAFQAASLEASYANKIVFISGDKAGKGAAIYTHNKYYGDLNELIADIQGINTTIGEMKYFSSIKVGEVEASAAAKDSVLKIAANDPATVEVNLGKDGINLGLTDAFKTDVANTKSGLASEIERAEGVEAKLRQDLGTTADEANAAGSAFARIAKLAADIQAMTGGNGSIADQINAAVALLNVDIVGGGEGEYITSVKQEDGKIVATKGTLNFDVKGAAATAESNAKAYADGLAKNYDATGSAAKALEDAQAYADSLIAKDSDFEKRVAANEEAIVVLNGEGAGSVKKAVADGIAEVVAGAHADFDTLKEVADWIQNDTIGATEMQNTIARLDGADTVEGSVKKQIKDAIATEVSDRNTAIADLKTELEGKLSDFEEEYTNDEKVIAEALTDLDTRVKALVNEDSAIRGEFAEADATTLASANKHADDAIAALNVTDAAVANQFVTAVSESAGKISVSRSAITASQIGIVNTDSDAFAAATANVQDALTELASFWAWEEL